MPFFNTMKERGEEGKKRNLEGKIGVPVAWQHPVKLLFYITELR